MWPIMLEQVCLCTWNMVLRCQINWCSMLHVVACCVLCIWYIVYYMLQIMLINQWKLLFHGMYDDIMWCCDMIWCCDNVCMMIVFVIQIRSSCSSYNIMVDKSSRYRHNNEPMFPAKFIVADCHKVRKEDKYHDGWIMLCYVMLCYVMDTYQGHMCVDCVCHAKVHVPPHVSMHHIRSISSLPVSLPLFALILSHVNLPYIIHLNQNHVHVYLCKMWLNDYVMEVIL